MDRTFTELIEGKLNDLRPVDLKVQLSSTTTGARGTVKVTVAADDFPAQPEAAQIFCQGPADEPDAEDAKTIDHGVEMTFFRAPRKRVFSSSSPTVTGRLPGRP